MIAPLTNKNITGKVIDHLGLVSATIDELKITQKVNSRLPLNEKKGVKVNMGDRIKAMILNGLGFIDDRLYLFEQFLENKPVDRFFREGVAAKDFNDDALGRCLDAIYKYGTTKFFSEMSFEIGLEKNLIGNTLRGDTTSLLVYGAFEEESSKKITDKEDTEEVKEKGGTDQQEEARPKNGHSKAKRPDLKQMILHLATTGSSGFPIWMEAHSGNASDKKTLINAAQRMKAFKDALKLDKEFIFSGDSAFYSGAVKEGGDMKWLSRVPENIKEAKAILLKSEEAITWKELGNGYKMSMFSSSYGNVEQRWSLISSEQAYAREIKTLDKNISNEHDSLTKACWHLGNDVFSCQKDAKKAALGIKSPKFHKISFKIQEETKHKKKGRPKKGEQPTLSGYKIEFTINADEEKISLAKRRKGRFIIATNQLDTNILEDEEMLPKYKEQSSTEGGFEFIKNDAFEVDSIFLKKPSRISALMAVMCLCLMVYGFSQHKLRAALQESHESIPDQRKKPTQTPRMQWVYRLFHGIQILTIKIEDFTQEVVINLNSILEKIVCFFGETAKKIYGIA